MAISVVLQDENGVDISEIVHDPQGVITSSLSNVAVSSCGCVRFVDPYGDTVFNHLQATAMVEEWDALRRSFAERGAEVLWREVRKLIVRCSVEPHSYLKFVGD